MSTRSINVEKPYLLLEEYDTIIEGLQEDQNIEASLRVLCLFDLDLHLEYTWIIAQMVESLMYDDRYGVIAEWLVRQWKRAENPEEPMEPRQIYVPRIWRKEASRFKGRKAKNFGLAFRRKLIQKKIRANPDDYKMEKQLEQVAEVQSVKSSATIIPRSGLKRKHT